MSGPIDQSDKQPLSFPWDDTSRHAPSNEALSVIELTPVFDIRNLWGIVKRRCLWLILLPLLTVGLALLYLYSFATHYYESSALIYVDPKFDRILQIEDVVSVGSDLDSLNSLEEAIVSDSMILRVVDKLGLRNDRSFLPRSLGKYAETEVPMNSVRLLKSIRNRYRATLQRPTRNIHLTAYDTDAERARLIAETFFIEFEKFLGEQKKGEADSANTGLRVQAVEARKRALEAEGELNEFRKNNGNVTVEQDHNLVAESLSSTSDDLNAAIGEVIALRSKVEAIQDIDPGVDPGKIIAVGNFSKLEHVSDLMSARTSARADFAVISEQYTSLHPKYREAENRVREVDQQLVRLAGDFKAALIAEYEGALKNEAGLKKRVEELRKKLDEVKTASSEFRAVQQKVEAEWQIHEQFQKQIGETTLSAEKSTSITSLWSAPLVGFKTTRPNKTVVVLAAGLLGCLGSAGLVMVDLFRDGPFASKYQVEDILRANVLAELSRKDIEAYSQNMTRAMAQIILTNQYHGTQIFQVINSGANPKVASLIAAGIANISSYYRAETLLLRSYESGPQGIYHLSPKETETRGLYRLDIPSSLLLTDNAWQLLRSKCERFKRVVIDSSEMTAESQIPLYFGQFSHQNIFVVDKTQDSRKQVIRSADRFRSACEQPISVVLVE